MAFVDYYKILGVDKNATEQDIKNAYRKLARKLHPDLNPNDKTAQHKFQEINEANEVLSDPQKRKKYDEYGKDWKHADQFAGARQAQGQPGSRGGQSYSGGFGGSDFSDFFESMFGGASTGRGRQQTKYRGQDYTAELQIDLLDAYKTHSQTITVNGRNLRITIPAGIEDGQIIKIKGHGSPGVNGGPNGDLLITFHISNYTKFKRVGSDLYSPIDLDLYTAILGGDITVDTLDGKVKIPVKPGTQSGSKIKLKGKGFPVYKKEGEFGDLILTFNIQIPNNITEKQKDLFKELAKMDTKK